MKNDFKILDSHTVVFLQKKGIVYEMLIDTEDIKLIDERIKNTIQIVNSGHKTIVKYAASFYHQNNKKHRILIHRAIMNAPKNLVVDHINRNTLDNRKSNLRLVTPAENCQNRGYKSNTTSSGYRGVSWHIKQKKYVAHVRLNGIRYNLGSFDNEKEAALVVQEWRMKNMPYSQEERIR